MKSNIKSSHVDYSSFVYDKEFEQSPYFDCLKKPVNKKAVLILSGNGTKKAQTIVNKLAPKGFKIYTLDNVKGKLEGDVTFVENGSDEFFMALAESKYIFAFKNIWSGYIKRDKQVFICGIANIDEADTLEKRVRQAYIRALADYYIAPIEDKHALKLGKAINKIANGSLSQQGYIANGKKELLFILDDIESEFSYDLFENLVAWIDYSKYNVSLLVDNSFYKTHKERLSRLDEQISIFVKKGAYLRDFEGEKRARFVSKEMLFLNKYKHIKKFLPRYLFEYELARLFGNRKFDVSISFGSPTFYWSELAREVAKKTVCIDTYDYLYERMGKSLGRARLTNEFDMVYFVSKDRMQNAIEYYPKLKSKAELLGYVPVKDIKKYNASTDFEVNGQKRILVDMNRNDSFDYYSVVTIDYFEPNTMSYIVTDPTKSAEENFQLIKFVAERADGLFVFDVNKVLPTENIMLYSLTHKFSYYDSFLTYGSLIERMKDCYAFADGDAYVAFTAKKLGKAVHFINKDFNEVEVEIPKKFDIKQ